MTQTPQFSLLKQDRDFPYLTGTWFPVPPIDRFIKSTTCMIIDIDHDNNPILKVWII